ncbi:unnamed protein product [Peronospora destructor]|uniref:Uncharacterized protein n=1 Tax=Peronospora destructor TaxID=86335 RepID=A0AAV0V4P5_9STRA|nr:unnamed protein product [Peronospora destructor]
MVLTVESHIHVNPHHLEYRPKNGQQHETHPRMTYSGTDGMDANAPVFKQGGGGYNLQHTSRPYNGPMGYSSAYPMGGQPGISRGPPGHSHHHQSRMRGPLRGAMQQQQQSHICLEGVI